MYAKYYSTRNKVKKTNRRKTTILGKGMTISCLIRKKKRNLNKLCKGIYNDQKMSYKAKTYLIE